MRSLRWLFLTLAALGVAACFAYQCAGIAGMAPIIGIGRALNALAFAAILVGVFFVSDPWPTGKAPGPIARRCRTVLKATCVIAVLILAVRSMWSPSASAWHVGSLGDASLAAVIFADAMTMFASGLDRPVRPGDLSQPDPEC